MVIVVCVCFVVPHLPVTSYHASGHCCAVWENIGLHT